MNFRRVKRGATGWYLALALLLAPWLGLMHGVVHGPLGLHGTPGVTSLNDTLHALHVQGADSLAHGHDLERDHAHGGGWLSQLFSAHGDDSDCRVFDQLCQSAAIPALPLLALPMALSSSVFHFLAGEVLARWAALFEARGPPPAR